MCSDSTAHISTNFTCAYMTCPFLDNLNGAPFLLVEEPFFSPVPPLTVAGLSAISLFLQPLCIVTLSATTPSVVRSNGDPLTMYIDLSYDTFMFAEFL